MPQVEAAVRAQAPPVPAFARGPVIAAMAILAAILSASSQLYGFHRDELYFRMLDPAWGYVDQPPLTPLLARLITGVVDEPWALRIPATLSAVAAVLVLALVTREVGGGRRAQALSAWAAVTASFPLVFGHVLLSASVDLVVWPLVCLFTVRAILRTDPRWWLVAGLVIGLSTYTKLLVGMLVLGFMVGVLVFGPWRILRSGLLWVAVAVALVVAAPNLLYQAITGWPQLEMGAALGAANGGEVRPMVLPFLFLLLGPPLVAIWVTGIVSLLRRPAWRDLRFLTVALGVVVAATIAGGAQFYYPLGLLSVLMAIGCVPVADWMVSRSRTVIVWAAVAVNGVVSALIALPLAPLAALGATPVPAINQVVGDTVGWPTYVEQIATVVRESGAEPVVVTSNYGEAGAIDRYGPDAGIDDAVYSGHNALWERARPPDDAAAAVFVGDIGPAVRSAFDSCDQRATLDNGVDVDNEEQGVPIWLCTGMRASWAQLWPRLAHLD
ncbi:glycosyltransferase family 39 protein [Leifsonia flava]|uniref:Glycosyltransferase RgtA/B/C/D-like domain-containing protein n=1 Tax=Orlajensenia leifsoniae TaxID=2561933 RepID=A0A4Y9R6X2_9MICO|nr:glycosyltransferase family 39 protein [Leifsonia flava]TFW00290.1 hypothetical protein E4M00_03695 [Leifsonia flava]